MALCCLTTIWAQETAVSPNENTQKEEPFEVVEVMPSFPGGMTALMEFIGNNLKYPKDAEKNKIEGRVLVQFIVEADGKITSAKVLRALYPSIDAEALRVVNAMPKWTPGYQKGKPVRVQFTLPLSFKLN